MKIIRAVGKIAKDFKAIYECEFCGFTAKWDAEDTPKFYRLSVPNKKCPKCGRKTGGYLPYVREYEPYKPRWMKD